MPYLPLFLPNCQCFSAKTPPFRPQIPLAQDLSFIERTVDQLTS